MSGVLFAAPGPVTLVGAGPVEADDLAAALAIGPTAVGADGGGDQDLPGGRRFAAVLGDMDSLVGAEGLRAQGVALHHIPDQDTTDLEKCLHAVEAPLYVGLGFLGGRLDHHLAAMNALARRRDRRVVLIGGREICLLCPRDFAFDAEAGTRVSLFPMAPVRGLASEGLRWSVAGLDFAPDGRIGTSNEALGGTVRLGFDAPAMLLILPDRSLAQIAARLLAP